MTSREDRTRTWIRKDVRGCSSLSCLISRSMHGPKLMHRGLPIQILEDPRHACSIPCLDERSWQAQLARNGYNSWNKIWVWKGCQQKSSRIWYIVPHRKQTLGAIFGTSKIALISWPWTERSILEVAPPVLEVKAQTIGFHCAHLVTVGGARNIGHRFVGVSTAPKTLLNAGVVHLWQGACFWPREVFLIPCSWTERSILEIASPILEVKAETIGILYANLATVNGIRYVGHRFEGGSAAPETLPNAGVVHL